MKRLLIAAFLSVPPLHAQSVAVFPADYANVPDGPLSSNNLPLANGTGRVLIVYESWDLQIPTGASIRRLGFREDAAATVISPSQSLQLEVRMGYTANGAANMSANFDSNYTTSPVIVFGPALYALPALRDPGNPLPNGRFWIDLTTPFAFDPAHGNLLVEYRIHGNTNSGASFTYRLDRADFYSPTATGPAGCPHASGTPLLALQPVRIGTPFQSSLSQAPRNSLAVLALVAGSPLLPPFPLQPLVPGIGPTCTGQIDLTAATTLIGFTNTSGGLTVSFPIPNVRPLYDEMVVSGQYAIFDFFAPGGVVVSNGAQVLVGNRVHSSILSGNGPPASVTTAGQIFTFYCPVAFFGFQ